MAFTVDTTFLVDLSHRDAGALALAAELHGAGQTLLAPTPAIAEFLGGSSDPHAALEMIQAAAEIRSFTLDDALAAGEIARDRLQSGTFPGWPDVFIMGFASRHKTTLITEDRGMHSVPVRTYRS